MAIKLQTAGEKGIGKEIVSGWKDRRQKTEEEKNGR